MHMAKAQLIRLEDGLDSKNVSYRWLEAIGSLPICVIDISTNPIDKNLVRKPFVLTFKILQLKGEMLIQIIKARAKKQSV